MSAHDLVTPLRQAIKELGLPLPAGASLDELRARIDLLDRLLLHVLAARRDTSRAIGEVKRTTGLAIAAPTREAALLSSLHGEAHALDLPAALIDALWSAVLDDSRKLQLLER